MFKLLLKPEEGIDTGGTGGLGKDDILDIFNEGDTPPDDKETKELETKEKEDDKEEDEIEIVDDKEDDKEIKLTDEDEIELTTPFKRKDILKKYPEVFKDFPYLEKAYFRAQAYNEIFPTIDVAKEALQKSESLDNFERELLSGDTSNVLEVVKKNDPNAFNKIVDNYLPNLAKVDEKAYYHVLGNVFKHAVQNMKRESLASKDEDLSAAADILSKFIFGHTEAGQPTTLAKEEPKNNEIETERAQFMKERFDVALSDVNKRVETALKSTIDINIDPKSSLPDYVRKHAAKEVFENLYTEIQKDSRFSQILDNLWREAANKKFDSASTDRIRSAFLSKAKTLLKPLILKSRNEAFKGLGKRVVEEDKTVIRRSTRPSTDSGNKTKTSTIPKGMSTLDYFNQE